jgi:dTDP-4-amino-4,6-dideoxygalactose transaminase
VIEDAAQAIGATYRGRPGRRHRRVGCFSFFPSKNLGAFGDAGLVTTNDEALGHECGCCATTAPSRSTSTADRRQLPLDALQAAVLRVKLPHLAGLDRRAPRNAERYRACSRGRPRRPRHLPVEPAGRHHIYNQFVVRVPTRDRRAGVPGARGIGTEIYYPCRSTCRSASRRSATRAATSRTPKRPPTRRWPCRSTAS